MSLKAFVIIVVIATIIGIGAYNISSSISTPHDTEETLRELIDESIPYDIFANDLENKFIEMENINFGGAGAGGIANSQASVSKEDFINLSIGEIVFYTEKINSEKYQYSFIQTYWALKNGMLITYEKEYIPPRFYKIEKEEHELVYYFFNPNEILNLIIGVVSGLLTALIAFFVYIDSKYN